MLEESKKKKKEKMEEKESGLTVLELVALMHLQLLFEDELQHTSSWD